MHDFHLIDLRHSPWTLAFAFVGLTQLACPATDDGAPGTSSGSSVTAEASSSTGAATTSPDTTPGSSGGAESATSTAGESGDATYSLTGTVGRSVDVGPGNDGVGTLFVAAFAECGLGQPLLAVTAIPAADLSAADSQIPFTLAGLPAGPVYIGLFLDDNGNVDPMAPLPDESDLVFGFDACDGELDCVPLEIAGADLSGVKLDLNLLELDTCP